MFKSLFFSAALAATLGSAPVASAQYGVSGACCGGCSGAQSYQRYSYQPAAATAVQGASPTVGQSAATAPAAGPVVMQPQSYRRYSYQPQSQVPMYNYSPPQRRGYNYPTAPKKAPWEYAKGERQRYLP